MGRQRPAFRASATSPGLRWLSARADARRRRRRWEEKWSRSGFAPRWIGRPAPAEIVAAVADGWFPPGARALDVGCGEGQVAAWLAAHGFPTLGIDIAPAAIRRARASHPERRNELEFRAVDICTRRPPGRFGVIVDRGCFHGIPDDRRGAYVRNLAAASTSSARMLLLLKAFRGRRPIGDQVERERRLARVRAAFAPEFAVVRDADTFLDGGQGADPERTLPGLAVWLERT